MRWHDVWLLLTRALRLRCPVCGQASMFTTWFRMRERCPRCVWRFEREEGYFTGAIAINLVVAELVLCAAAIWLIAEGVPLFVSIPIGIVAAFALPLLGWPFSRSLWVALDLVLHPIGE
jgi:uncharacterized protein (DUF983 family)